MSNIVTRVKDYLKKYVDYIFIAFAGLVGVILNWNFVDIIVFVGAIWLIIRPLSAKKIFSISAAMFLIAALLIGIGQGDRAEDFAVFGFTTLVFAIVTQIFEYYKENK